MIFICINVISLSFVALYQDSCHRRWFSLFMASIVGKMDTILCRCQLTLIGEWIFFSWGVTTSQLIYNLSCFTILPSCIKWDHHGPLFHWALFIKKYWRIKKQYSVIDANMSILITIKCILFFLDSNWYSHNTDETIHYYLLS